MKTKYSSNAELSHIWANQIQSNTLKTANSMSCQFNVLYSYNTAIAQIHNNTPIINRYSYSNTTSKHQSHAFNALDYSKEIIDLEFPKYNLRDLIFGQGDFDNFVKSYNETLANQALIKSSRSRKYKDMLLQQAISIFNNLKKYSELLNLDYSIPVNLTELTNQLIIAEKEKKEKEKILLQKAIEKEQNDLELWKKGQDIRRFFNSTALRIKRDVIETSRGANIPLEHAVKFWALIKKWHDNNITYEKGSHSIHLGHYIVDSFKNNILKVGCHEIPYSEIKRISKELQL
jgi:hypothetical protein